MATTTEDRELLDERTVGTAVGDAAEVVVGAGVGEFSGVGVKTGRGVKVGRGVRVGVAVGLLSEMRLPASHASTVSIATNAITRKSLRSKYVLLSERRAVLYTRDNRLANYRIDRVLLWLSIYDKIISLLES